MNELDFIGPEDLESLRRQVAYTFLDAYGNTEGADILFDLIVKATEERIIKLLQAEADHASNEEYKRAFIQFLADLPYTAEELFGEEENK